MKSKTLMCITAMNLLARKTINSRELRWLILAVVASISFAPHLMADLGSAKSFVVLSSSGSVTLQNRDAVSKPTIAGATTCPGAAGCTMRVGGNTILIGRGNSTGPDQIGGDLIARATASQGLNCAGSRPGTTAICLGNISSVSGACITGGGAVSNPTGCGGGVDTSGTNPAVAALLPKAGPDAAAFSASLAALPATQTLSAINLAFGGSATITANAGLNVISVPFIVIGSGATLTISGRSGAQVAINVGSSSTPGVLTLNLLAKVLLSGGITPDRVVFNVVGAGGNFVQLGNTITFNGTILAPQQSLMLTDGSTPQPTIINGALLFGLSVSIGNNVNINFYPLAQIVQPVVFTPVTTVDVMQLPTPIPSTGPNVEADAEFEEPIIEELPPTGQLSPLSVADSPSAIGASAAVVLRMNQASEDPLETGVAFDGLGNVNGKLPPDTQIAVGQTVIVEMVNVSGAVYDKVSGRQLKTFDLGKMFGANAGQGTDPRVMYDAASRHFFAAYELKTAGGDDIRLAVAADPTTVSGTLQFPWTVFDIRSNNVDTCFDQPKLGFSDDKVMLSWNDYNNANSCSNKDAPFSGSEIVVADKASLFTNNGFGVIVGPDTNRFQIFPVQSLTPTAVQYAAYHPLTGVFAGDTTHFRVMAFAGRVGPDLSASEQGFQIRPTPNPPDARQPPGGNPQIDVAGVGTRLLSAVWHNDYLWATMNEGCTPLGDTTMRSCGRLVKVSPARSTLLEDRDLQVLPQNGVGVDLYYPAVILNSRGDLFFGFTVSSTALNPTAAVFGVLNSDFNSLQTIKAYAVGTQVYRVFDNKGNFSDRWGDYSGAAIDPVDPNVVWLAQEYSKGDWGTAIARVFFGSATTITYHQTGACNGFVDSSGGHSAGPNQAYAIFGIERIDNSGGPSFAFDPANLYVQQGASRHFFDSSLSIYSGILGPFAAVPTNLTAGQNLGFNPTAQGALVVSTAATDGASEANNTAYFLNYNRKLNDPPVNLVKSDASRTSWPNTPDCKTITLQ